MSLQAGGKRKRKNTLHTREKENKGRATISILLLQLYQFLTEHKRRDYRLPIALRIKARAMAFHRQKINLRFWHCILLCVCCCFNLLLLHKIIPYAPHTYSSINHYMSYLYVLFHRGWRTDRQAAVGHIRKSMASIMHLLVSIRGRPLGDSWNHSRGRDVSIPFISLESFIRVYISCRHHACLVTYHCFVVAFSISRCVSPAEHLLHFSPGY